MEINKTIVGILVSVLIVTGTLVPYLSSVVSANDINGPVLPMGRYDADDLDGWEATVTVSGSKMVVDSTMWSGEVSKSAYVLSSDAGSVWFDGEICSLMGSAYSSGDSLSMSISGGTLTVGGNTYQIEYAYVLSKSGGYNSYGGSLYNSPVAGVGSYAGITVSSSDGEVTGNDSGYVLDSEVVESNGKESIEVSAGEVDVPSTDPYLPDIEHEDDPIPESSYPGPSGSVTSGTTGECTWELDGTTLYIRGNGAMGDYSERSGTYPPWPTSITSVIIEEGVTSIGMRCFGLSGSIGFVNLTYVSIPSTLLKISSYSFENTKNLKYIEIPGSVTSISDAAFQGSGLKKIKLNDGLISVGKNCFKNSALTEIVFPSTFNGLGVDALRGCSSLTHIYLPDTATVLRSQGGYKFIDLNGTNFGTTPTGDLYLGSKYVFYKTVTAEIDGYTYHINYIGAEIESAPDTQSLYIPYTVTYNDVEYTIESIAANAITGSSVRYLILPQTIQSVSTHAITAPNLRETLNLSECEISAHGNVRETITSSITIGKLYLDPTYDRYMSLIQIVPVMILIALIVAAVGMVGIRRI